jgi:hypothetical protein
MGESLSKERFTVGKLSEKYKFTPDLPVTATEEYKAYAKIKVEDSLEYQELKNKNKELRERCLKCESSLKNSEDVLNNNVKSQFNKSADHIVAILKDTKSEEIKSQRTYDSIYSQLRLDYGDMMREIAKGL